MSGEKLKNIALSVLLLLSNSVFYFLVLSLGDSNKTTECGIVTDQKTSVREGYHTTYVLYVDYYDIPSDVIDVDYYTYFKYDIGKEMCTTTFNSPFLVIFLSLSSIVIFIIDLLALLLR